VAYLTISTDLSEFFFSEIYHHCGSGYGTPAIILKLADRIANVESCLNSKDSRYKMYLKEKSKFEEALRVQGELTELWDYLNSLFS
jgi:hypothetical protein